MSNRFPDRGLDRESLFAELEATRENDVDWRDGRLGIYTHFGGDDVLEVAKDAARLFFSENALGPTAFPSLKKLEDDVIGWTLGLFNGGDAAYGNMTSGGTESIFVACKTARDWARAERPVAGTPEIVAPYSAHPAFSKAAHFLGMRVTRVPLRADYRADVDVMAAAIGDDTVMLVGSAPQFPHGVFDPIAELADLAKERALWFHVDACVGGFIAPFVRRLGHPIPDFDFSLPGVTSISADLHKYGFTAKGASTVTFHDQALRPHQIFEFDDWSRGHYASPTFPGTRPGGPIAAAWAVLRYLGEEGYVRIAGDIMNAVGRLRDGIQAIDGLELIGDPDLTVLSYASSAPDIFDVAEAMGQRGWFVTRSADPRAIHMGMMTMAHVPVVDRYLEDLAASVEDARSGTVVAADAEVSYGG